MTRSRIATGLLTIVLALAASAPPAGAQSADSVAALDAFRANIAAIHAHDRARYIASYLRSPRLVRAGPAGLQYGYRSFAAGADDSWPDTLVADHFEVTPLAPGVVYGAYRYRVAQSGTSQRGVSERVMVETDDDGWKVAVTTAFASPPGTPPPAYALVGATLIDGTGVAPVDDAVVVMRDGEIACAGARGECDDALGSDVATIDASGSWIMPGIVDAHVHYSQTGWADGRPDAFDMRERFPYARTIAERQANPEDFFRASLCSGVTANFDVGGYPWTWDLRARTDTATAAPHVGAAGPLLSTHGTINRWLGLPGMQQFIHMADAEATRAGSRFLLANETDAIKVWFLHGEDADDASHYLEMLRIAGREAERAGTPLIVHATGLWQAKQAIRAGARLLVHGVGDRPVDDEFLRLARENDVIYTPTLVVRDGYIQLRARDFDAEAYGDGLACVDPATRAKAFLTDSLPGRPDAGAVEQMRARSREGYELALRNVKRVHDAGVTVAMGTDAGNPLTLHGPSVYLEMEALQEAGLSPMDVIVASTRGGARAMGRADDFGTIEPGLAADLIVLGADPTEDIVNARQVRLVVRRGEIWTRAELEFTDAGGGDRTTQ